MEIICPKCKKTVRIPDSYSKPKGKCPKCSRMIDFVEVELPITPIKMINLPEYLNEFVLGEKLADIKHPIIDLFKKHKRKFIDYSGSLHTLNEMLKTGKFRKTQYVMKELSLKGKYLSHFIEDIDKLNDFPLENKDKILLWEYLFSFFPYFEYEKGSDVVFNLYQRYSVAKIIESAYISLHLNSVETRLRIIYFSIQHQRNQALMEKLIEDIKQQNGYELLKSKVDKLVNDNSKLMDFKVKVNLNDLKRIFEDFAFGINWIRIYLD